MPVGMPHQRLAERLISDETRAKSLPFCTMIFRLSLTVRPVSNTMSRKLSGRTSWLVRTFKKSRIAFCRHASQRLMSLLNGSLPYYTGAGRRGLENARAHALARTRLIEQCRSRSGEELLTRPCLSSRSIGLSLWVPGIC